MPKKGLWKKVLGVTLILIGILALVTPLTPGAWLAIIGAELLGFRLTAWERLRDWWKGKKKAPETTP